MRVVLAALATVAIAGAGTMLPSTAADAIPGVQNTTSPAVAPPPAQMLEYDAADYAEEAEIMPSGLIAALERDLDISGEEYLAQADAASDASAVIESLSADGIDILGSSVYDTTLTVNVSSRADAVVVERVGAVAVIGEPKADGYSGPQLHFLEAVRGGMAYIYERDAKLHRCSVGFNGRELTTRAHQFATAGHCEGVGGSYFAIEQVSAANFGALGDAIGSPVPGTFRFGAGYDVGVVAVTEPGWTSDPTTLTWGGGAGAPLASAPVGVRDQMAAIVGAAVCKSGSTTGWTCGRVQSVDQRVYVDGSLVNLVVSDLCMLPGDSGGSALIGNTAVGINSAGSWVTDCNRASQPDARAAFFPMVSGNGFESVTRELGDRWELSVQTDRPQVTSPAAGGAVVPDGSMSGTVAGGNVRSSVAVYFDGQATPRIAPVSSSGSWSLSLAGLARGSHSYTIKSRWGTLSESAARSGTFAIEPYGASGAPVVDRITGADRYEVAVKIAQRGFPSGADVVYIVTGAKYPDALSAAPAAVNEGAPLLLTASDSLPSVVRTEISRLAPSRIVVVGGPASVSAGVLAELRKLAPRVDRITGIDRYEASRSVVDYAFDSAPSAYVVTGTNFPDALSAGAAGGSDGFPVILVDGPSGSVDEKMYPLLDKLAVGRIKIAGGPNSVSPRIEYALASARSVTRLTGVDRFAASQSINADAFSRSSVVYLATGYNYPDALAGSALAGKDRSPLFVVPTDCVPQGVLDQIANLGATRVTLLGGPVSLTPAVQALSPCSY